MSRYFLVCSKGVFLFFGVEEVVLRPHRHLAIDCRREIFPENLNLKNIDILNGKMSDWGLKTTCSMPSLGISKTSLGHEDHESWDHAGARG